MKDIDTLIACACKELNVGYLYATLVNQEVILKGTRRFPTMIRTFGEAIKEAPMKGTYTSDLLLFFADQVSSDQIDKIHPAVRRMQCVAFAFVDKLRSYGVKCTVGKVATALGDSNAKIAGVSMELTVEYEICS